ncbi:hypothetical protein [Streptomyces sp. NPDC057939]|uniref:hypothetical protein n=1 Tax=Streptomyces sp. NPDC057939 TaxID=3346284 RepID=UPI0036E5EB73
MVRPTHSIRLISFGYLHPPIGPDGSPNPERNRYLISVAERHRVPVRDTLAAAVAAAPDIVAVTRADRPSTDRWVA